jgi:pimeloyl-ACP methyl ester carboxylesterase
MYLCIKITTVHYLGMDSPAGDYMEESVLIDGINIYYGIEGDGEPLLLIHGMAFSHDIWEKTIMSASKFFKVYAPDLPGFGRSDKPAMDYGLPFYVDFIKKFMDMLNIDKCSLAGMSLGGEIAVEFASVYPERVDRLVIVSAGGFSPLIKNPRDYPGLKPQVFSFLRNDRDSLKQYLEGMLYNKKALREDLVEQEWARMKDPAYRAVITRSMKYLSTVDPAFPGTLSSIQAKTLIIWGKDDPVLPAEDAFMFNEHIPDSDIILIERCGHVPVLEKNEELNRALLTFLAETNLYYSVES